MIREGHSPAEATRRFYPIGVQGLFTDDMTDLLDFQQRYARPQSEVANGAGPGSASRIGLAEVVAQIHPTMLIGTSTHAGAFTEPIVRDMAPHFHRPVIMPMSKCDALPADLIAWTEGRVLTATGGPFAPVLNRFRRGGNRRSPGSRRGSLARTRLDDPSSKFTTRCGGPATRTSN
jgi:malate dehydrogenase (oxaloacetate-decarboxylating)